MTWPLASVGIALMLKNTTLSEVRLPLDMPTPFSMVLPFCAIVEFFTEVLIACWSVMKPGRMSMIE
jgi:hypothetical protein